MWAEDLLGQWNELLTGAKLERRLHASSGAAAESSVMTTWDLCRDGTFHSSQSATASVKVPGSLSLITNQVSHTGRWSVEIRGQDALLVFTPRDGQRSTYTLTSDGQETYLDGERVVRTRSPVCPP